MNPEKIGSLIFQLRKEKNLTQKQLGEKLGLSDKTISKWERGLGCPDISLLRDISKIFNVNIEKILLGDLQENDINGGNMKRIKFYVCPNCGNVINYYVEINHEMTKDHFISFVAYVTYDRVLLIKLYPEQSPTVRFPRLCGKFERGKFYMYCNQHGLLMKGR